MSEAILKVENLRTYFHTEDGTVKAVDGVSINIPAGQTLGVVGESGSGKSVTSLSIMGLLPKHAASIESGKIWFEDTDLLSITPSALADLRGRDMAMIFQEPMTSLNPVFRVGDQVAEAILRHEEVTPAEARDRTLQLFHEVGIPDPESRIDSFPHEMSGGQKQRVMIAMALACNPKLLIADEPTTALDVTIQAQILDLLRDLRDTRRMSMLFITHDLGVIAEIADQVAVMFRGKLVEYGDVVSIFANPQHAYTKALLDCRPRLDTSFKVLPTVADYLDVKHDGANWSWEAKDMGEEAMARFYEGPEPTVDHEAPPLLDVQGLKVHFPLKRTFFGKVTDWVKAVDGISFKVQPGQTLGLVGESGCGKTTTGRAILRLVEPTAGTVLFDGKDLGALSKADLTATRRDLQIIFQDPYSSLNPRLTVEQAITEPMLVHGIGNSSAERRDRAAALLEEVGLLSSHLNRFPHEFSGGQRQRICIARTLALEPKLIICDESVSALDVSVQAQVLNLLNDLKAKRNLTYIFISHDLSVVKFMSDVMCVMKDGLVVEAGAAEAIYQNPETPYTQQLIEAIPRDDLDHIKGRQQQREDAAKRFMTEQAAT